MGPSLHISAYNEADLLKVKQLIQDQIMSSISMFHIPAGQGEAIAMAHRIGEVLEQHMDEEMMQLEVRVISMLTSCLGQH